MASNTTFIYASIQKEGYHCFPEAATDTQYATNDEYDVSHLANRHMHYFFIKVWVQVHHLNRDIEFIQFKRWLDNLYGSGTLVLDSKSCEMIADDLYAQISERYPNVEIRIDVSEDNINGALVEFKVPSPPVACMYGHTLEDGTCSPAVGIWPLPDNVSPHSDYPVTLLYSSN